MVRGSQTVLTVTATVNVPFHFLLIIPCDLCRWFLNGKVSEEHSREWICQAMVLCPSQILRPLWTSFNSLYTKRISFIFSPCLMKTWQGEYLMRNLWGVLWACRLLPLGNCKSFFISVNILVYLSWGAFHYCPGLTDHFCCNENFSFNQNYPARSVKS